MNTAPLPSLRSIGATEIINGVPHGIAILDADLRVAEMNSVLEVLTGFSITDARGVLADFILRCNLANSGKLFRTILETAESISQSSDILNQHRKKIPVQLTISPLRDETGAAVGLLVFIEDISALQSFDQKRRSYDPGNSILGHSPQMEEIFELLPVMAHTDASVLITGETGTGKDMIAEAIHKASKRARHPFIKVNCGALPEALLESELFGHVRGAFTGAVRDKPGLFSMAQNGTIFLTEIGDLPLTLQVKLLSVLDDKEFFPVGGVKKVQVNVRIIAATHRYLRDLVKRGEFREDLFYRLNVLRLHMPPLREREGDIRLLLDYFRRQFNTGIGKEITGYSGKALDLLTSYAYPGNIRELRNIVEYAVNICQGKNIQPGCLPGYLLSPPSRQAEPVRQGKEPEAPDQIIASPQKRLDGAVRQRETGDEWSEIEKELIIDAMKKSRGNRTGAAHILGWGRTTLWRKMNRYGLN